MKVLILSGFHVFRVSHDGDVEMEKTIFTMCKALANQLKARGTGEEAVIALDLQYVLGDDGVRCSKTFFCMF